MVWILYVPQQVQWVHLGVACALRSDMRARGSAQRLRLLACTGRGRQEEQEAAQRRAAQPAGAAAGGPAVPHVPAGQR